MTTAAAPLVAVICEDDADVATALAHTLRDLYGMRVAATVRTAAAALVAAASIQPNLVVIDLALTGQRGLRIVPELHEAAPGCAVVVSAPPEFIDLRPDAVASGAVTLVKTSDLRPLQCSVERLISVHGENARVARPASASRTGVRTERFLREQPAGLVRCLPGRE